MTTEKHSKYPKKKFADFELKGKNGSIYLSKDVIYNKIKSEVWNAMLDIDPDIKYIDLTDVDINILTYLIDLSLFTMFNSHTIITSINTENMVEILKLSNKYIIKKTYNYIAKYMINREDSNYNNLLDIFHYDDKTKDLIIKARYDKIKKILMHNRKIRYGDKKPILEPLDLKKLKIEKIQEIFNIYEKLLQNDERINVHGNNNRGIDWFNNVDGSDDDTDSNAVYVSDDYTDYE